LAIGHAAGLGRVRFGEEDDRGMRLSHEFQSSYRGPGGHMVVAQGAKDASASGR
jgi:hypothetical protein